MNARPTLYHRRAFMSLSIVKHFCRRGTVKALCERFFFWRHAEFQKLVHYPKPQDPLALRQEIVRLHQQGWTEIRIVELLRVSRRAVRKWLQRAKASVADQRETTAQQMALLDLDRKSTRLNSSHLGISYAVFCL